MVAKEDSILYDLLVHAEWPLEGEVLVSMNWPPMNALKVYNFGITSIYWKLSPTFT